MTARPLSRAPQPRLPRVGVHVSIAGKLSQAIERAVAVGATTMQIFSRSPRMWRLTPLDPEETERFKAMRHEADLAPLAVHAPYLINIGAQDMALYRRSVQALTDELERSKALGADYLVVHVGSCAEPDQAPARAEAVQRVARAVREALDQTDGITLLLENTAGERGDLGADLDELAEILNRIGRTPQSRDRLGVCLDTCHAFAAGYDFTAPSGAEAVAAILARTIGPDRLKLLHVNDSKKGLGCRVDRHEHIGQGHIGAEGFRALFAQPIVRGLPLILETPKDSPEADPRNLALVQRLWGEPSPQSF